MTKKSRRPLKNGRDQVGCICSFIRVFDFRIGWSTRKLISDKKHGGRQTDEIQTDKVSVKDIVQKEMCFEEEKETSDLGDSVKKEPISKMLKDLSFKEDEESLSNVNTKKNRNLFIRKHKPLMDHTSDRIVILKPGTSRKPELSFLGGKTERFSSQFSFTEIKKKLKQAITKERNRIPYQRLIENSEKNIVKGNLGWNSPTRDHFFHERFVMPVFGSKKEQDKAKTTKVSIDGKKRLSEIILTNGDDEIIKFSSQEVSKTLEQHNENTTFDCQTLPRLKIAISTDLFVGRECQTSEHQTGDVDSRNNCSNRTYYQDMDLFQADESSLTSPTTRRSISKTVEVLESSSTMRPERLSPVSVLDPITAEDDSVSPPTANSTKRTVEPRRISFEGADNEPAIGLGTRLADEESAFEYVEAVLLASDLNWDEFLSRWMSSHPLLDSSLFHEVELFSTRSLHEQKVLFDCTNEILQDFCECYFSRYSNMQSRPRGEDVIREVWKGVDCNLSWPTPNITLDDTVKRDMEKNRKWMSLRSDIEKVGIEIEEMILEQLVEETVMNEVVLEIE